ncbi:hypothetical protein Tco_1069924 [Tanacetum coccineum]|uniref:Uncharacterized protein n=1 Tax=Tanacetum coccineum TaxID=301880 RepID=A0ABQ5HLR2_9ASTR
MPMKHAVADIMEQVKKDGRDILLRSGYIKDRNQSKMTKLEMDRKMCKNLGQRPKKVKSMSVQKIQQSKPEPEMKEYYWMQS